MKTIIITIDDAGSITITGELTDQDKIAIGNRLYDQEETDNEGQILFYTGIYETENDGT